MAVTQIHTRKKPQQERSRKRVQKVLQAARDLISEKGLEATTISDVAQRASVPIGSVYQFFPNKTAIILELISEFMTAMNERYRALLEPSDNLDACVAALMHITDEFYEAVSSNPVLLDLFSAFAADRSIAGLDIEDTKRNSALIFQTVSRFLPAENHAEANRAILLFVHISTSVARLALTDKTSAKAILDTYKATIQREMYRLAEPITG
jgi:AcrR family transcriptional regulator